MPPRRARRAPQGAAGSNSTQNVASTQNRQGQPIVSLTGSSGNSSRASQVTPAKRKNDIDETFNATDNPDDVQATASTNQRGKRQKTASSDNSGNDASENPRNGLDQQLKPITNVHAAFEDLVKRGIEEGLDKIANRGGYKLRVATMCSGTEAPVFSLKMIAEAFRRAHPEKQLLEFSHIFSAEIVDFKQAYISRNTEGSIIFRDVKDFIKPEATEAPTAMGASEKIPTDIDLLVAGCSCVDFSTLNSKKQKAFAKDLDSKDGIDINQLTNEKTSQELYDFTKVDSAFNKIIRKLDDLGESAITFFSMLSYAKNHQPKIIILENVQGAPWNAVVNVWFPYAGYEAAWVKLDTKDYYIPQTRSRGYLIAASHKAFGKKKAAAIVKDWSNIVNNLKRRASSPVTSWLLPAAHPLTERARQDDSERALRSKDPDNNWERSKARHRRVRLNEGLGNARPLTEWGARGSIKPYDRMDRLVLQIQPDRVLDCIDIYYLRGLTKGHPADGGFYTYDMRRKTRIYDLSQNIDRGNLGPPFGMSGCLTPAGIHWISDQNRLLSGFETLLLQGLPLFQLNLSRETQNELRDLSGNAMTTTVVGATLIAAFISIDRKSADDNLPFPKILPPKSTESSGGPEVHAAHLTEISSFSTTEAQPFEEESMKTLFERSRRYCFCNRAAKYSTDTFQLCDVCKTIRCEWCARNPPHYVTSIERPHDYLLLGEVEQEVMRYFPGVIVDLMTVELKHDNDASIVTNTKLMNLLRRSAFYYQNVCVTEVITVCYSSKDGFQLRAKLSDKGVAWYLYLDPWCEIGQQCKLSNANLQHPVARAMVSIRARSVLPSHGSWEFRDFGRIDLVMNVVTSADKQHLAITVVKDRQFSEFPPEIKESLIRCEGSYEYKPGCDAPEDSLHSCKENNLFLFKDTTTTDTPEKDAYVVSDECRQLEPHEYREVLVKFQPYRDLRKLSEQDPDATDGTRVPVFVEGFWKTYECRQIGPPPELRETIRLIEVLKIPFQHPNISSNDKNSLALAKARLIRHSQCDVHKILPKYESLTLQGKGWVYVEKSDLPDIYNFLSYFMVKLGGVNGIEKMYRINQLEDEPDTYFAPKLPEIHWVKNKTGQLVPHNPAEEMKIFEQQLKARPSPFEVQVRVPSKESLHLYPGYGLRRRTIPEDMQIMSVRYLTNPNVLAQQAVSYLPIEKRFFVNRRKPLPGQPTPCTVSTTMSIEPNSAAPINPRVGRVLAGKEHVATGTNHKFLFVPFSNSLRGLETSAPQTTQPKKFKGNLTASQRRSLGWMVQQESYLDGNPSFTEIEREEFIVPELQLRLVGSAERRVHRNGGILADDVGYGKTVITLALVQHQEIFDEGDSMKKRKRDDKWRKHLKATLVVVPPHLVEQWAEQASKFLEIDTSEVMKVKTFRDLKDRQGAVLAQLENARLIIVSNTIFSESQYLARLGQVGGVLTPPNSRGRPFQHWYENATNGAREHASSLLSLLQKDRSEQEEPWRCLSQTIETRRNTEWHWYSKYQEEFKRTEKDTPDEDKKNAKQPEDIRLIPAKLGQICGDFFHLLEYFSFSRIVYDEFSYENRLADLFVKNAHAFSKWVLSATPPTRNLRTVCTIADLLNVHVARPVSLRAGLPRITEGPREDLQTRAEIQLSYRHVQSDRSVHERVNQGHEFLKSFASANPMDSELLGHVKIEEVVVVCAMNVSETIHYLDLQQELRNCSFDADSLSKNFLPLLPHGLEWKGSGRAVAAQALILGASLRHDISTRQIEDLRDEREALLNKAIAYLEVLTEKAIWLARRILSNTHEMEFVNATSAIDDVGIMLEDFWNKSIDTCGGHECWEQLSKALVGKDETYEQADAQIRAAYPQFMTDREQLFNALYSRRKSDWRRYYNLKLADVQQMSEDEATSLLKDVQPESAGGKAALQMIVAIPSLFQGARASQANLDKARSILDKYYKPTKQSPKPEENHWNSRQYTSDDLVGKCRSFGIKAKGKKSELAERLLAHEKGTLDASEYVDSDELKISDEYPHFKHINKRRGGTYTISGSDISDASLALRNVIDQVINLTKRHKLLKNLAKPFYTLSCDACGQSTTPLNIVCECGHVLCKSHLGNERCPAANSHGPIMCQSRLKNATVPLSKIEGRERILNLPGKSIHQVSRATATLSSKTRMIVDTIASIPKDEFVLLFAQFNEQLRELENALNQKGITCTRDPTPAIAVTNFDGMDKNAVANLCAERGLPTTGQRKLLVQHLEEWNRGSPLNGMPKVRILRLNDCTSAGTNLQYANHVMFASPLVVDLQEEYDGFMKQARGRCLRYGQEKTVRVYHFVTADTVEVDMLELRTRSDVVVSPGMAVGALKKREQQQGSSATTVGVGIGRDNINSILDQRDVWKAMNETNWLTMVGIDY
ncbi:hypothetical protein F5B20DRAFT_71375 [Whalleya microplaca]|nr:hypothetical protein F5B20DRAFT_71375 [Whalleya microplaca]